MGPSNVKRYHGGFIYITNMYTYEYTSLYAIKSQRVAWQGRVSRIQANYDGYYRKENKRKTKRKMAG